MLALRMEWAYHGHNLVLHGRGGGIALTRARLCEESTSPAIGSDGPPGRSSEGCCAVGGTRKIAWKRVGSDTPPGNDPERALLTHIPGCLSYLEHRDPSRWT